MTKRPTRNVTASEIAALAGVSQATVSLVLNQRGDAMRINRKTQQRVVDAAKRLNYVPNYLARGLKGASTQTVALLWSFVGSASTAWLAHEMARLLTRENYLAYLADTFGEVETTTRTLLDLAKRRVDGLVLQGAKLLDDPRIHDALSLHQTVVVVTDRPRDLPFDQVVHDRLHSYRQMADHLATTGRRKPAFLGHIEANLTKLDAFKAQLAAHGIDLPESHIIDLPWQLNQAPRGSHRSENCFNRLGELFPGDVPFDALVCINDHIAMAGAAWLRSRGMSIPADVALFGFNNIEGTEYQDPPLATVDRLDDEVVDHIHTLLFDRMANPDLEPRQRVTTMQFVPRQSAG